VTHADPITPHPVHELILARRSPRAFSSLPVEPEKLRSVFEAARWAASSVNEQPWNFLVVVRGEGDAYGRLLATLAESNQHWAARAPVLILTLARTRFTRNGRPNRHALHDLGMAFQSLALQAVALGLVTHPMGGFDAEKARAAFSVPEDVEVVAVAALGYPGAIEDLPEDLRAREIAPRTRKALAEFVHAGGWGRTAPWLESELPPPSLPGVAGSGVPARG
jgi:nitroreductase